MVQVYAIQSKINGKYLSEVTMVATVLTSNFREGLGFTDKAKAQRLMNKYNLNSKFKIVSFIGHRKRPSRYD